MAAEMGKPLVWGETDCVATVDRWISARSGRSPLREFGEPYDSEHEAAVLLDRCNLPIRMARALRCCGFRTSRDPLPGGVGIVVVGGFVAAAIRGRSMWLFRGERGGLCGASPSVRALGMWDI